MKKWMKILMSISMAFSFWACAAKTEVTLTTIRFESFYLGDSLNPSESERIPLSSIESNQVEAILDNAHWAPVYPDKYSLEPVGLLLYDVDRLRYEMFQVIDTFVIKVTEGKSSPIYFESAGNISTLIEGWFRPFKTGTQNKIVLSHAIPIKANTNVTLNSVRTEFNLTSAQAESLISMLRIDSWTVTDSQVTDDSPKPVISITLNENGDKLMFYPLETTAVATYLQIIDGHSEMTFYSMLLSTYNTVQATLNQWRAEGDPIVNPRLSSLVFTQVKFPMQGVPERILKPVYYPITKAESDQAKLSLNIDQWKLLSTNPTISGETMSLQDDQGLIFTVGHSENNGYVVQVSDPVDPTFLLSYKVPENPVEIMAAFLTYWEAAQATKAMMDFMPVELGINSMSGESGSIRTVTLSTLEAQTLLDLLKMETWHLDPYPDKYAFGWEPSYILDDGKGSSFRIYSFFTHDLMSVVVKDPQTKENEWIWYITSNTIFEEFATYIKAQYPMP